MTSLTGNFDKIEEETETPIYTERVFTGERACFATQGARFLRCTFENGESPLKESGGLRLDGCLFKWKYPLWYCKDVVLERCTLFEMARAGIWYTENLTARDTVIEAPKEFRRCKGITLENVQFSNAAETLWSCDGVKMKDVFAKGDYFAMNSENIEAESLRLVGNYSFDGAKNAVIRNARLLSKDAFWNSENVTVYDSFISGEYLGWNAKNLTLVNCTVESLQGMCYIDSLKMVNCRLLNTTLAFEYSTVDAEIEGAVDSVLNPGGGRITCERIGELILEADRIDPSKTKIVCRSAG